MFHVKPRTGRLRHQDNGAFGQALYLQKVLNEIKQVDAVEPFQRGEAT